MFEVPVLDLATVDQHALLVESSTVILPCADLVALSLDHLNASFKNVILHKRVRALPDLPLSVKTETASELVDLVLIAHGSVALSTLDHFGARVGNALPHHLLLIIKPAFNDLPASIKVQPANQIHLVVVDCKRCALSWGRQPLSIFGCAHLDIRLELILLEETSETFLRVFCCLFVPI